MENNRPRGIGGVIKHIDESEFINQLNLADQMGLIFIDEPNWIQPPMHIRIDETGNVIEASLDDENTDGRC